ncbi:MAG TPA: DUF1290 domain-containing protein [Clostridia bacterium]|nr:DUF1290 domain-containing protein [Clostridia bacterium]
MVIIIGLLIGLLLGLFANVPIPSNLVPYLAVFTLVGLESLTGSYHAIQDKEFEPEKFLIEFFANITVAVLVTALGNQMKYDFSLVVSFIFAYRIFRNINFITRRFYLHYKDWRSSGADDQKSNQDGASKSETK